MTKLFLFNETFTNGLYYNLLIIISLASVLCGIFVIISKNPIVSVLFLIGLFLNIAAFLMMLGVNFIGLSYLLVYVGAVSILFLFILMLINVRISELVTDNNNSVPLAAMIGIIFFFALNLIPSRFQSAGLSNISHLGSLNEGKTTYANSYEPILTNIDTGGVYSYIVSLIKQGELNHDLTFASSQIWDGALAEFSHITSIGNVIYTVYPLWLIITSLILLLAMVGAIVITIKQ